MAVTRVLLACLPRMLGDIVRSLADEDADVVVAGAVTAAAEIPAAMRTMDARVAVVGGVRPAALPALLAAALAARAAAGVVALDADGVGALLAAAHGTRRVAPLSARELLELVHG